MFISSTLLGCRHEKDGIAEIKTQIELQDILTKSQGPIVVSLQMKNCGWCKKMHPIVEQVAHDKKFHAIGFYTADAHALTADDGQESLTTEEIVKQATGQNIPGYPFIVFMNKGKFIDKQVGGIVQTSEQKNKNVSEEEIFAKKVSDTFPNSVEIKAHKNQCPCGCK
jgi:thiol-disulfide isomerase/thioredoxin